MGSSKYKVYQIEKCQQSHNKITAVAINIKLELCKDED